MKNNPTISAIGELEVIAGEKAPILAIQNEETPAPPSAPSTPAEAEGKVLGATDKLPQTGINIAVYAVLALFAAFLIEKKHRKKLQ